MIFPWCILKFHDFSMILAFFQIPWFIKVWKMILPFSRIPWFFHDAGNPDLYHLARYHLPDLIYINTVRLICDCLYLTATVNIVTIVINMKMKDLRWWVVVFCRLSHHRSDLIIFRCMSTGQIWRLNNEQRELLKTSYWIKTAQRF